MQTVVGEVTVESGIIGDVIGERERDLYIRIVCQKTDKRLKLGLAIIAKLKVYIGAEKV